MTLCLVTGGAGFIGSHTVDLLLDQGYDVRVLDVLQARVHPNGRPPWLSHRADLVIGDVANVDDLRHALDGVTYVIHLAAYQDYMLDFSTFLHTNAESTALLFELIVGDRARFPVQKVVLASSQSVSGEGRYICSHCTGLNVPIIDEQLRNPSSLLDIPTSAFVRPESRPLAQLALGDWDLYCPTCNVRMQPVLIEESTTNPITAYAISKYAIELLSLRLGKRYDIPTVCMRYTYVQGPHNSFHNPYSGVARRFALQILRGEPLLIYEDGQQLRDYVHVSDVARANLLALQNEGANWCVLNVGGGRAITVLEFASMMLRAAGIEPNRVVIPGMYRVGDTRHTISDISQLMALGWKPEIPVEVTAAEYFRWVSNQPDLSQAFERLTQVDRAMEIQSVVRSIK